MPLSPQLPQATAVMAPTPAVVLERMCNAIQAHDPVAFMDEVQFFWRAGWKIQDLPAPVDPDPLRRALKACIVERMAEVWQSPPKNEEDTAPTWCAAVPAIGEEFSVVSANYRDNFSLESPIFRKRNIFAPRDFMFFV